MAKPKPIKQRAGTKIINNIEVPMNAIIKTGQLGRDFYVSGIGEKSCIIRYIDNGELRHVSLKQLDL